MEIPMLIRGTRHDEDTQHTNGIYAHGKLNDIWEFDLVTIIRWKAWVPVDTPEGIYDAWFILPNNEIVEAKLFLWLNPDLKDCSFLKHSGLVVKADDTEYLADAQWKYEHHCNTCSGWYTKLRERGETYE